MQALRVIFEFLLNFLWTAALIFIVLFVYMFFKERGKGDGVPARDLALGLAFSLLKIVFSLAAALIIPVTALAAVLFAVRTLYPGALELSTLAEALPMLVSAWIAVFLVRKPLERGLRFVLDRIGPDEPWSGVVVALVEGLAIGISLAAFGALAHAFDPSIEVPLAAAVVAGVICGFTSYYVGLYLRERGFSGERL